MNVHFVDGDGGVLGEGGGWEAVRKEGEHV